MGETERRRKAMRAAVKAGAEALLVTHLPDVRYLSGFTGSNGVVALAGRRAVLFTDGRYTTQARAEAEGMRVVIGAKPAPMLAIEWLAGQGVTKCAFDPSHTTVTEFERLRKAVPGSLRRKFFSPAEGLIPLLREVKDADEIARMRKAAALGCALFEFILGHMTPAITEAELAAQLEFQARMAGAEAMSFETIVAGGKRSALPHGLASRAKLPKRGFVTLDFGVVLDGYCSDMTRTVHMGKPSRQELDVYHSVLEAQEAAVAAVAAGVACGDVDEAARSVLRRDELDKYFSHSTGHGVGLEIHEGPRVASKQVQKLEPGMVVTVEPGVYLPEQFGVRIEDMVLVGARDSEVLTAASPKGWIEL
jgi:Xaa-Pro aminopeptidase